jgi:hypothetical protein
MTSKIEDANLRATVSAHTLGKISLWERLTQKIINCTEEASSDNTTTTTT